MNLYSPDIIKNDFHFSVATYSINHHTHEETFSSIYDDENTHKSSAAYFIKKAPIHTNIMEILDYDMPEKESAVVAFRN